MSEVPASRPVEDSERELVLSLLPQALGPAGLALACEDLRPSFLARARLILETLEAEGKVYRPYPNDSNVWKVRP
jgi:hypothetical protein